MGEPLKTRSPAVVVVRPNVTISMVSGVQLLVPHGGIFAALIPAAVTNLLPYLSAIVSGTVVTTAALFVLKKAAVADADAFAGKNAVVA